MSLAKCLPFCLGLNVLRETVKSMYTEQIIDLFFEGITIMNVLV